MVTMVTKRQRVVTKTARLFKICKKINRCVDNG